MVEKALCPSREQLQEVLRGQLDLTRMELLEQHLKSCPQCEKTLQNLQANDTFTDMVCSEASQADQPVEPVVEGLIQRILQNSGSRPVEVPPAVSADDGTAQYAWEEAPPPQNEVEDDGLAPPQAADEIGRLGPYRIVKVLGEGGMGKVFLAEDPALQRSVALKVMKRSLARDLKSRKRFLQEARTAAKIEHDNIIPIYQVGEDRGIPFLAMPLLKGSSLEDLLCRAGALQVKQVLRVGIQVAQGLAAAHANNLIHRDIKPANIWIEATGGGRVKILDFGLARDNRTQSGLTQSGAILGTPAYMPPEQARGEKVDHRVDLYSLGCVLYRMTTGELPFKGNDTLSLLLALATEEPLAPNLIKPEIPRPLSDLIMQLLAKDPAKRLRTAQEVVQALKAMERGDNAPAQNEAGILAPALLPLGEPTNPFAFDFGQDESSAEAKPSACAARAKPRRRPLVWLALAAVFGLLALFSGGIFYIVTDNGTIEIKTDDKDIKIIVEDNGGKVTILDPASKQTWILNTGKYTVRLDGNPDGLEIDLPSERVFEMKRGGKQVVSIRKVPAPVGKVEPKWVKADGTPIAPPASPGAYALSFAGNAKVEIPKLTLESTGTIEAYVTIPPAYDSGRIIQLAHADLTLDKRDGRFYFFWKPVPGARLGYFFNRGLDKLSAGDEKRKFHVAGVWSRGEIRFYGGGKLDGPKQFPERDWKITAGGLIGKDFTGIISEVRISKVARYDKDFTPAKRFETDADTLALYHFDEGSGDKLTDSSGNGHHGKIVGAKWVKADGTAILPVFFNGKDLAGWVGKPGHWRVENGDIVGAFPAKAERKDTTLYTERMYGDFELSFRCQLDGKNGLVAGLIIRDPVKEPNGFHLWGPAVSIMSPNAGSLWLGNNRLRDAKKATFAKPGELDAVIIRCVGRRLTVTFNGVVLSDGEAKLADEGRIGWCLFGNTKAEFRIKDLRFTNLTPVPVGAAPLDPIWLKKRSPP